MQLLTKKRLGGIAAVIFFITFSLTIVSIPSDELINFFGTDNAYLIMFIIAFIGSISTFAGIPYPLILMGFAAGGLNPLLLGVASAFGVSISDTITYFLARRGSGLLPPAVTRSLAYIETKIGEYPRLTSPALYTYGTCSPLSNDLVVISFSLLRVSYWRTIIPLGLGNLTYNIGLAFVGVYAYDWIVNLF